MIQGFQGVNEVHQSRSAVHPTRAAQVTATCFRVLTVHCDNSKLTHATLHLSATFTFPSSVLITSSLSSILRNPSCRVCPEQPSSFFFQSSSSRPLSCLGSWSASMVAASTVTIHPQVDAQRGMEVASSHALSAPSAHGDLAQYLTNSPALEDLRRTTPHCTNRGRHVSKEALD